MQITKPYLYNESQGVNRNQAMSLLVDIEGLTEERAHNILTYLRENAGIFWASKKISAGLDCASVGLDQYYLHYDIWPVLNPRTFEIDEVDKREIGSLIGPADMRLGDTVVLMSDDGPTMRSFGSSVVKQIDDESVTLFRPYVNTADFSYTGGVICYIGVEQYRVFKADRPPMYMLLAKKKLR